MDQREEPLKLNLAEELQGVKSREEKLVKELEAAASQTQQQWNKCGLTRRRLLGSLKRLKDETIVEDKDAQVSKIQMEITSSTRIRDLGEAVERISVKRDRVSKAEY